MPIDTRSLKIQARSAMRGTSPSYWQITLVYLLLISALPNLIIEIFDASLPTLILQTLEGAATNSSMLDSALIGLFVSLTVTLISIIIQLGYSLWALRCWRHEDENGFGSLFEGFASVGRILLATLLIMFYSFFWLMLLSTAASPIFFALFGSTSIMDNILMGVYLASFVVAFALIYLRYALVPFVLIDRPDLGAFRAVGLATLMVRGRIWKLFRLYFSFIWLFVLANLLSNGVSMLVVHLTTGQLLANITDPVNVMIMMGQPLPFWLGLAANALVSLFLFPYITVATAGFYDALVQPPQPSETPHNTDIY